MPSTFVGQTLLHSSTPEHSSRKRTHTDSHDPSSAECKLSNRCDNLRKSERALYESSFQQKNDRSTQTVKHITNGNETCKCGVTVTINWPSSERSKQIPRVLSTGGGGKLPPLNVSDSPPKSFTEKKNLQLFQIKIFFDDDFKESVKVTNVQKCDFSQS